MKKNIIDETEVFAINDDCKISYQELGPTKVKVIIVDNFYKNPHMVRDLALAIPATSNRRIRGNNPANRINAFYILDNMAGIYDHLLRTYWPEIMDSVHPEGVYASFMQATFSVNVMQSENLPNLCPHVDNPSNEHFASTIYLNTDEECAGGTSFYNLNGPKTLSNTYVTDSIDNWEMIGIAEMKFNRMVLYNSNVYHTAYIKPGMFTNDLYRINQQFFI